VLSVERLVAEVEGDFRCALQAARRDFADFSSETAVLMVGMEDEAMSDML
jgi:hypothetical protein